MQTEHDITFFYLVFQSNILTDYVYYWVDGKQTRQIISLDKFLKIAQAKHNGKLYSLVYTACRTTSFYLWNSVDENIIHLFQRIDSKDSLKYENSMVAEFSKFKKNPLYNSQQAVDLKKGKELGIFSILGLQEPSQEYITGLTSQLSSDNAPISLLSKIGRFFSKG